MSQQRRPQQQQNRGGDQNRRQMVQARETFLTDGVDTGRVDRGDLFYESHPVVRANAAMFGEPRVRHSVPESETR